MHTVTVNSHKGQEGRREENEAKAKSSVLVVREQDNSESHSAASSSDLTQLWNQVVQNYTFLKLKKSKD